MSTNQKIKEVLQKQIDFKNKLVAMSKAIGKQLEKCNKEKMECHPSLVKVVEMERQKWVAKAETMVEVLSLID